MDWITMIGSIASIITCVLFVFYIVGRVWSVMSNTRFQDIDMHVDYSITPDGGEESEVDLYLLDDENSDAGEYVIMTPEVDLNKVEAYEVKCDFDDNGEIKFKQEKLLDKCELKRANTPILIKCIVPEGIPSTEIVYERFDGIKGQFFIGYEGKGEKGVATDSFRYKRTLKSILYYLSK